MITETTDVVGQTVKVGDRVAVAFRSGNLAELRVGTVTGFGVVNSWEGPDDTVRISWEQSSNGYKVGDSGVSVQKKRFVKLG